MNLFWIVLCLGMVAFLCWYSYQLGFLRGEESGKEQSRKFYEGKETALRLNYHFVPRDNPTTRYRN